MTSKELELTLKETYQEVIIKPHPTLIGLSQVYLGREYVCACPTENVKEDYEAGYVYEFPNGMFVPHNSVEMIKAKVKGFVDFFNSEEGKQLIEDEKEIIKTEREEKEARIQTTIKPLNEGN